MSTTCPDKSRGNAIVVAVFVLAVLSALGAYIATISSGQQLGSSYDIQGARAYQAAHFGSEWGVYQVLIGACSGGDYCANCRAANYAAPTSQNVSGLSGSLSAFSVTVTCGTGAASYSEGGSTVWVYQITATACNQPSGGACPNTTPAAVGSIGYVERRVSLTVTN